MAAPGLTKLFDKLNILEIQIKNVLCKAVCCGVFKLPRPSDEQDRNISSEHVDEATGERSIDHIRTRPVIDLTKEDTPTTNALTVPDKGLKRSHSF